MQRLAHKGLPALQRTGAMAQGTLTPASLMSMSGISSTSVSPACQATGLAAISCRSEGLLGHCAAVRDSHALRLIGSKVDSSMRLTVIMPLANSTSNSTSQAQVKGMPHNSLM